MGKVTIAGTGGGADLDVITAAANDILAGKVIVGLDGEPLTGTLALTGTAADSQVLSGKSYYNTDAKTKRTGTMLTMGGQTITPGAAQQTVSCAGRYMTGNIVVNGTGNILKCVSGITTSGGETLSMGSAGYWYYCTVNPGINPAYAISISNSIVWRSNSTDVNFESARKSQSGFVQVSASVWDWSSWSVKLPCGDGYTTCYYWIFGY